MILLLCFYAGFVLVAVLNLVLLHRPKGQAPCCFEVMIPARNEVLNLESVIPPLISGGAQVTVFDDESTDGTGDLAEKFGARVIRPNEPLPHGWTGKNRACHELSLASSAEWVVLLDADTVPSSDFVSTLSSHLTTRPKSIQVVSGFPKMLPGKGLEPAYLSWVPWILLAANPFGLVSRSGIGHSRFTNGQFVAWRRDLLVELRPFETLKGEILEDVKIGRMLAKKGKRVEIIDLGQILSVRMYWTLQEAIDGMSKNSGDIGGSVIGSVLFGLLLGIIGLGWIAGGVYRWPMLGCLLLSKFLTDRMVRGPWWTFPLAPITCLAASLTVFRSLIWKRKKAVQWKGRTYSH